eukprot:jgi/Undpi1/6582/HiC_scaffold_20.g09061.m1
MAPQYVVGVDGGTEGIRASVFDTEGNALAFASCPYGTIFPRPGWAEQKPPTPTRETPLLCGNRQSLEGNKQQSDDDDAPRDPDDWWVGAGKAIRQAVEKSGVPPEEIVSMGLDTTCCSVVALDSHGRPLRPCLLWMDMRSAGCAEHVANTGDAALGVNSAGEGPVSSEWMIPKALWLKQNEPEMFAQAKYICEYQVALETVADPEKPSNPAQAIAAPQLQTPSFMLLGDAPLSGIVPDFMNFRLTGRMVASVNNASVRWHYSTTEGWPVSLLRKLDLAELQEKWPSDVIALGDVVGGLSSEAAAHLGLREGLPVAQGGADAFVGMGMPVRSPPFPALWMAPCVETLLCLWGASLGLIPFSS